VEVRQLSDPDGFLCRSDALLASDEARHNLIYGLVATLRADPSAYPTWHLWLAEEAGTPVAAAIQTPPHNLVLARPASGRAIEALAGAIAAAAPLPGVTGARPEVDAFADAWRGLTGADVRPRREQRIYALRRLVHVPSADGASRDATPADADLLRTWLLAFGEEAIGDRGDPQDVDRVVEGRLRREDAGFLLWVAGGTPVSLAGWGGPTPTGIRIGPVYTPPERRGRGYASAVTAELSARQLAGGRRHCFLYTDAANPTANRIYVRLGYEHVCDSRELTFGA
jgi:predicted GNAT family acetyltransferase